MGFFECFCLKNWESAFQIESMCNFCMCKKFANGGVNRKVNVIFKVVKPQKAPTYQAKRHIYFFQLMFQKSGWGGLGFPTCPLKFASFHIFPIPGSTLHLSRKKYHLRRYSSHSPKTQYSHPKSQF